MSDNKEVNPTPPPPAASAPATGVLGQLNSMMPSFNGGKKSKKRGKTSKKRKGKRSSMKKRRGGSCGGSTGANAAMVAGDVGSQVAAPGGGNMLQYQNINSSQLSPAAISGGKKQKRKGGTLMDMAVPALLVVGSQYAANKKLPIMGLGVAPTKLSKAFRSKRR